MPQQTLPDVSDAEQQYVHSPVRVAYSDNPSNSVPVPMPNQPVLFVKRCDRCNWSSIASYDPRSYDGAVRDYDSHMREAHSENADRGDSSSKRNFFGSYQSLRIDSLYLSDEEFDSIRGEEQIRKTAISGNMDKTDSVTSSRLSMMNVSDFSSSSSSSSSSFLHLDKSLFLLSNILRNSRNLQSRWPERRYSDTK